MNTKKKLLISYSYAWKNEEKNTSTGLSNDSHKAFLAIKEQISNTIKEDINKCNFRRLRGSAGSVIFETITQKIEDSDIILVDISGRNPNVMLELGMALAIFKNSSKRNIFLICKGEIKDELPSNLNGYFVSQYDIKEDKAMFKDNGSLRNSLVGGIRKYISEGQYDSDIANVVDELKENDE